MRSRPQLAADVALRVEVLRDFARRLVRVAGQVEPGLAAEAADLGAYLEGLERDIAELGEEPPPGHCWTCGGRLAGDPFAVGSCSCLVDEPAPAQDAMAAARRRRRRR